MSTPTTRAARDAAMRAYEAAARRFENASAGPMPLSYAQAKTLREDKERALLDYYAALPAVAVSRCPHCGAALARKIDRWGLDGYWWQEALHREVPEPPACPHFRVLTGAVNLQRLAPHGGTDAAYPGPEVPYVVPRLLGLPTMIAVVYSFELSNGYRAFPIAYFSVDDPPPGSLTQTWTLRSYGYRSARGRKVFTYDTSPWDFAIARWIDAGRLAWIAPDDPAMTVQRAPADACPYASVAGLRQPLVIKGDTMRALSVPDGHAVNPFNE